MEPTPRGAVVGRSRVGPARRRPRARTIRRPSHPGGAALPPPVRRGGHPGKRAARGARSDRPRLAGSRQALAPHALAGRSGPLARVVALRPGWRLNRTGHRLCLSLLREGRPLLVFPEGYPAVDPKGSHKTDPEGFLPFDAGFLVLAERAGLEIPILPVGLWYSPRQGGGWTVWLRFGRPLCLSAGNRGQRRVQVAAVEVEVRRLSAPPTG
jgi:hypothetical protein